MHDSSNRSSYRAAVWSLFNRNLLTCEPSFLSHRADKLSETTHGNISCCLVLGAPPFTPQVLFPGGTFFTRHPSARASSTPPSSRTASLISGITSSSSHQPPPSAATAVAASSVPSAARPPASAPAPASARIHSAQQSARVDPLARNPAPESFQQRQEAAQKAARVKALLAGKDMRD